jgi:polyisoprenoid-binding protein YceI
VSTSPATGTAVVLPPAGTYVLDAARSTITFHTRHMFGLGGVHGSFAVRGGQIEVADPPDRSSVTAEIDAGSFTTGNGTRDGVVRSARYLDVERRPAIRFVSGGVAEAGGTWELRGTLTVREVERPVRLAVESCACLDGELRARATTRIDRFDFGITAQRGMTGRYLRLVLDVVAGATS